MSQVNPSKWDNQSTVPRRWGAKPQPRARDPYEIKATLAQRNTVLPFKRPKSAWGELEPIASVEKCEQDVLMTRLEEAAKAGNETAFVDTLKKADWQDRQAGDFVRAVQLALEAGAHLAARQLSAEGARRHPANEELQKQAYILSPPKVVRSSTTNGSTHRLNRDWLKAHANEYQGRWVAVRNGELLGEAGSMEELIERIGDTKGVLLTVV